MIWGISKAVKKERLKKPNYPAPTGLKSNVVICNQPTFPKPPIPGQKVGTNPSPMSKRPELDNGTIVFDNTSCMYCANRDVCKYKADYKQVLQYINKRRYIDIILNCRYFKRREE